MKRRDYEKALRKLQTELTFVQSWAVDTGYRGIIVFEGRDAAGKGGIIKAITERVSPRVFRVVALPTPSDREKTQIYAQRYLAHFPAAGEIIIFDRSWYNRAGVETVMGFCTPAQTARFLRSVAPFEKDLAHDEGIQLIKYWLEVAPEEQKKRFQSRIDDPSKNWKLSPMDLESRRRWYDYSRARDAMLDATDTEYSPWHIVNNTDKRRGRLNCISHLLSLIPYEKPRPTQVELPRRSQEDAYDDREPMQNRNYVPERF